MNKVLYYGIAITILVLLLSGLWIWGTRSGPATVKTDEGTLSVSGDENSGQLTFKTQGEDLFSVAFDNMKLVKGFPRDIPVYSPSKVSESLPLTLSTLFLSLMPAFMIFIFFERYKRHLKTISEKLHGTLSSRADIELLHEAERVEKQVLKIIIRNLETE